MTETELTIQKSPLEEIHNAAGAIMSDRDGWTLPALYGDELFEYAAVRESGAGVIDLSSRGRLLVTGSEAVSFLNGLVTNDMKTLEEHRWMPAVFPNVQGRLLASVRIIRGADDKTGKKVVPTFIIDTEAATLERVFQTIQRFTFAGDFHVRDLTGETVHLSVQGKQAASFVHAGVGVEVAGLAANAVGSIYSVNRDFTVEHDLAVIWSTHTGANGFDLIVNVRQAAELWNSLVAAGARPVGHDALERLRVEAGIPRYGKDMDDANVVTETNLDDAVSYTKGCYIGQEIIARIKYRGHVAKKLRGLMLANLTAVERGALIRSVDDKVIGRVTSSTYSPTLGRWIALGYLKYEYIAAGTEVRVAEDLSAQVADLPFVRALQKV